MGKTITTYLIKGEPTGPRYVFLDDSTCKMFVIPRSELKVIADYKASLSQPALYILLGEDTDGKPKAYVGSTDDFSQRILQHDNKKDFWSRVLVFISATNTLDKADSLYLEFLGYNLAARVSRYILTDNKQTPKAPTLPEWKRDTANKIFETIKTLTSFVGCSIFSEINVLTSKSSTNLFYCTRKCRATAIYTTEGLTLLKGSELRPDCANSISANDRERRAKFISAFCKIVNGTPVTTCDVDFQSPSNAAMICVGGSANGWIEWKNKNGNTLDSIYRK